MFVHIPAISDVHGRCCLSAQVSYMHARITVSDKKVKQGNTKIWTEPGAVLQDNTYVFSDAAPPF